MKIFLFLITIFLITFKFNYAITKLSGTYTIGGVTPDYETISLAVNDFISRGVSSPVVFNIRTGNYDEQMVIPEIDGASYDNTITFKSETDNAEDVNIAFSSVINASTNYIFLLDTCPNIIFRDLSFYSTSTSYSRFIVFRGASYGLIIDGCLFHGNTSTSENMYKASIFRDEPNAIDGGISTDTTTIINSKFYNNSYGLC